MIRTKLKKNKFSEQLLVLKKNRFSEELLFLRKNKLFTRGLQKLKI